MVECPYVPMSLCPSLIYIGMCVLQGRASYLDISLIDIYQATDQYRPVLQSNAQVFELQ